MESIIFNRCCNPLLILFIALMVLRCVPITKNGTSVTNNPKGLENGFAVPPQKAPPRSIQSLQLYRKGAPTNPPIIELQSDQKLLLAFDYVDTQAKQFKVSVSHYDKQWQESTINPGFYLNGFYEAYFGVGEISSVQNPAYRHYEYEFPNEQFSIATSGNYLLSISDALIGQLLFTLPFLVSEEKGDLQTTAETEYAKRNDLRTQHRLFSKYLYPDFVEFPQFDLSFIYVQNQFWGRSKLVNNFDTSTPKVVNFHLSQDEAFLGNYEFSLLDIRSFRTGGDQILSYRPETTPPTLILRRDVQNFASISPATSLNSRFGRPVNDRDAEYAMVNFQLETVRSIDPIQKIYLIGDFNNWTIDELNRMAFDNSSNLWKGSAFIKQGQYAYKYVIVESNTINDLVLDRSFTYRHQEYITLIYYKDPTRHYDRLLKVNRIEY